MQSCGQSCWRLDDYVALAGEVIELAHAFGAKVMLNSPPVMLEQADGLHLTSAQLWAKIAYAIRPREGQWLSASCHDVRGIASRRQTLGWILRSCRRYCLHYRIRVTAHLGWEAFTAVVDQVNFPVYALGGMESSHVATARLDGGQGIAAIRSLWDGV